MMMRSLLAILMLSSALGLAAPAFAQVTDQTDQSEEVWRKSRKKSGNSDIYRRPNTSSTGLGLPTIDYDPPTALERLPSESRRHVMRERAKAIAESPDGDLSNVAYTPSEDAQSDEALMRDEQAAWEEVTASPDGNTQDGDQSASAQTGTSGSQGSSEQGDSGSSGQAGPQGDGQSSSQSQAPRGGSAASLQEIMDAIKSGQSGGQSGGSASQGDAQSAGNASASGSSEGQSGEGESGGGDSSGSDGSGASGSQSASRSDDLSPLEIIRRSKEERAAEGRRRSASEYLGHKPDEASDE